MYYQEKEPWTRARLDNGSVVTPLITLTDEHGGVSHIILDDKCYVLINKGIEPIYNEEGHSNEDDPVFKMSPYWYESAAIALACYLVENDRMPSPSRWWHIDAKFLAELFLYCCNGVDGDVLRRAVEKLKEEGIIVDGFK